MTDLQHIMIPIVDTATGRATTVFYRYLQNLKRSAGGASDDSDQNVLNPTITETALARTIKRSVTAINSAYTTAGDQILICTSAITVTLNNIPADNEQVTIKRTNGEVIIDAGAKTIDGASTYTMLVDYEGVDIVYSAATDEWYKV